jgi:tryptophan 2,3-dioxygenase
MSKSEVYYSDYLQLNKVIDAQLPESRREGQEAHDEMLFIITHQAYELWFKQMLHELTSVIGIFKQPELNDNSPDIFTVLHRLKRVAAIWELAIHQVDVIETMTPLDFLDFRDSLRPASGFQSYQFKMLEAIMGLRFAERHGKAFFQQHLREKDIAVIERIEKEPSLIELLGEWLERMPFFNGEYWQGAANTNQAIDHPFWEEYIKAYKMTLGDADNADFESFKSAMFADNPEGRLSAKANRAALFILLYRDFPILQIPFQLLDTLISIDDLMSTWRTRHISLVRRMIGGRAGTGGSSGAQYLKESRDKHLIFNELASLNSFLIKRINIPVLPEDLQVRLGFQL